MHDRRLTKREIAYMRKAADEAASWVNQTMYAHRREHAHRVWSAINAVLAVACLDCGYQGCADFKTIRDVANWGWRDRGYGVSK